MPLSASTRPVDHTRATRCVIAWLANDKPALDYALHEVMHDPVGTPGQIFALIDDLARLGNQVADDFADQAWSMLIARLSNDRSPKLHAEVHCSLVIRESTGPRQGLGAPQDIRARPALDPRG